MTEPLVTVPASARAGEPTVRRGGSGAVGLVLGGAVSVQAGAAIAVLLFPRAGVAGVVTLRLVIAAVVLLAVCRPRLRGHTAGDWWVIGAFGIALAGMNALIYEAIERIPLGVAVTIEGLGPLALSVVTGRRASGWLWAALALGGVVLLGRGDVDGLDPIGVVFAVGAAAMWAAYILLSVRTGARFPKADGLALAMTVAAALTVPWGAAVSGSALLDPGTLGLGATVAVLSSVLPYTLELLALRRMPTSTFAVLMSLGPAVAALAGYVVLDQALAPSQLVAVGLVIGASAGAVHTSNNGSQRSGLLGGGEREAGNGQQPEGAREVEVVEDAGAQVRDEGSGEEEDQPDGGGDPEVAQTAMSRTTPDIPRRPPPSAWRAAAATMVAHPSPRSCPGRIPLGPGRLQRPQHWPRL